MGGRLVVVFPDMHRSGGPAALHHVHSSLNRLGIMDSLFFHANPVYADEYTRNLSSLAALTPPLGPQDLLMLPMGWSGQYLTPDELDRLRSSGTRAVTYVLGVCFPHERVVWAVEDHTQHGVIPLSHSHYVHRLYSLPWPSSSAVLLAPLEKRMYVRAKAYYGDLGPRVPKENLVLIDSDAKVPLTLDVESYKIAVLHGMTFDEMIDHYMRAKVVVDTFLNGLERVTCEGVLFDAFPVLSDADNGQDSVDFPVPDLLRVDLLDETALDRTIKHILLNYGSLLSQGVLEGMKRKVLGMPETGDRQLAYVFGSKSLQFLVLALDRDEEAAAWAAVLSVLYAYPMCSVELRVRSHEGDVDTFLRNYAAVLQHLERLGLSDRHGGRKWHSVRVRALGMEEDVRHGAAQVVFRHPLLVLEREPLLAAAGAALAGTSAEACATITCAHISSAPDMQRSEAMILPLNCDNILVPAIHSEWGERRDSTPVDPPPGTTRRRVRLRGLIDPAAALAAGMVPSDVWCQRLQELARSAMGRLLPILGDLAQLCE